MKKQLYIGAIALLIISACTKLDEAASMHGQHFSVGVENYIGTKSESTRAATVLSQLTIAIYNDKGALVSEKNIPQPMDLSSILMDELADGSYTAVFMAVGEAKSVEKPIITVPKTIEADWIPFATEGAPIENEYLYAKSPFTIAKGQGISQSVSLSRLVGRVEVEPMFDDKIWKREGLTSAKITFEQGTFYASHKVDNNYSGQHTIRDYQIINHLQFYTLPATKDQKISGHIVLKGKDGEKPYEFSCQFELLVSRNKRAVIRPINTIYGDQYGLIRVYDEDRNKQNSHQFFQDNDSYKAVASHSFRPTEPLVARFEAGKMVASFYAADKAQGVTLLARRPSDSEFFELAWFESLLAFEQRSADLSGENKLYRTQSGKMIMVNTLSDDMVYKVDGEDRLIQSLKTITWPVQIRFMQPEADTSKNLEGELALRAIHAREAVAQFTNTGFVFSQPEWAAGMLESQKKTKFHDNGRTIIIEEELFPQIWNPDYKKTNYIVLKVLSPTRPDQRVLASTSLGSGDSFAMQQRVYYNHYMDGDLVPARATSFHEYNHTFGYGDSGNITYLEYTEVNIAVYNAVLSRVPYPTYKLLNSNKNPSGYRVEGGVVK